MSKWMFYVGLVWFVPTVALGGTLVCPDSLDDMQGRDVMATSAPEVKVRATTQNDGKRWAEIVRPLTVKAVKQAKAQRAMLMQEGIEKACPSNQYYVGRLIPVPERVSGCEQRVVTRPADDEHLWVQVVAICKYDSACCTTEEAKLPDVTPALEPSAQPPAQQKK
jgi:hypothetical protein